MIYLTILQLLSPQVILSLFLHVPLTLILLDEAVHVFWMKCGTTGLSFMFYFIKFDKLT